MKISVDNLATDITEEELRTLFECFGKVLAVKVEEKQGTALVDMPSTGAALEAIEGLDGQTLRGSDLNVRESTEKDAGRPPARRPRPQRRRSRRR